MDLPGPYSGGSNEPISAGYWSLAQPSDTLESDRVLEDEDEIGLKDPQWRDVPEAERRPGTQYYSVARIRIKFQGEVAYGTGFMVTEDIMVTAAHCVYDWNRNRTGPAQSIKAYFGYENKTWTEIRHGSMTIVSTKWMTPGDGRKNDLALVRLSPRYATDIYGYSLPPILPFKYPGLSWSGNEWLFIPGHPRDRGDNGLRMHESSGYVRWNLSQDNMLLGYGISTFGGLSGAPVVLSDRKTVVAIHVSGDRAKGKNFACPIGPCGVSLGPFIRFFEGQYASLGRVRYEGELSIQDVNLLSYNS
ncbi:trypsin-like cysteine/serine peptidase domain-containing protein [Pyrenochaeta sp. MPI-SDFR-AT-0127]|nr:trypsin-like cysteine/serine peptidase domain-containing protein [Pyrenochaeta sp. MPI-SDFR-AT-0127]